MDQKYILACKKKDPIAELIKLREEDYAPFNYGVDYAQISSNLMDIAEKYIPNVGRYMLIEMNSEKTWMYRCDENAPYFEKTTSVLVSLIRFTDINAFKAKEDIDEPLKKGKHIKTSEVLNDRNKKSLKPLGKLKMRECPFCGYAIDSEDGESVHPTAMDKSVWRAGCVSIYGGCDAYVLGDSKENSIANWNKRI